MPIIDQQSPLSAGADAAASYIQTANDNRARALALAYARQSEAANDKRADDASTEQRREFELTYAQKQKEIVDQANRDAAADKLAAQQEADRALHEARRDAIDKAKQDALERKDAQTAKVAILRIEATYRVAMAKVKEAADAASIRAAASVQAANVRAAAEVQSAGIRSNATIEAAGIHEQGADRRAHDRNALTRRGQDLTAGTHSATANAANGRALLGAMRALSASKNAPKVPTPAEDPKFAQAAQQFIKDSPADRAALIANPKVPAATRAYFQALAGVLAAAPSQPMSRFSDATEDDEDDD